LMPFMSDRVVTAVSWNLIYIIGIFISCSDPAGR
jgi:hypothetical protein